MNTPLAGALILYAVFLVFYAVWSFFLGYHLLRFGPHREVARTALAVYLGVTALLLLASAVALARRWPG